MSPRPKADPLALRVSFTFHAFLMATEAGQAFRAGKDTDSSGEPVAAPLLGALRRIAAVEPRGDGSRAVPGLLVEELDALVPMAEAMGREYVLAQGVRHRPYARGSQTLLQAIAELREIRQLGDPQALSPYEYPLHHRLRERQEEADAVMRFVDWLTGSGSPVTLAESDHGGDLRPSTVAARDLMLAFLDIPSEGLAHETYRMEQARL